MGLAGIITTRFTNKKSFMGLAHCGITEVDQSDGRNQASTDVVPGKARKPGTRTHDAIAKKLNDPTQVNDVANQFGGFLFDDSKPGFN